MKILKFEAPWCAPCKAMDHILELMDLNMEVEKISIDTNQELCDQYEVRAIPTLIMIDDNKNELNRIKGFKSADEIMEFVKN